MYPFTNLKTILRPFKAKKKLIPSLNKYELIIFDNAPNWNLLIENSLVASNIVIAPISCEIGTYQALKKNLNALVEFKEEMEIEWEDYLMIPTLLENNKISKEILGAYYSEYGTQVTAYSNLTNGMNLSLLLNKGLWCDN